MNKKELIQAVSDKTHTYKGTVDIINATLEVIFNELAAGGEVNLRDFGRFHIKARAARTKHVPRTGEAIQVPAHKAPYFTASAALKAAVNHD